MSNNINTFAKVLLHIPLPVYVRHMRTKHTKVTITGIAVSHHGSKVHADALVVGAAEGSAAEALRRNVCQAPGWPAQAETRIILFRALVRGFG